jgi:serine/threonine protein kinase
VPVAPSPWDEMVERLRRATAGEFDIGPELGRGGMAAVFLAHDLALDRQVAIKVMSPAVMLGDGMTERFRQEAVTIARLHHPHIVPVYAVRHGEGLHYFVMRYVRGRSLDQVIRRAGRLPLPIVRSILWQVAAGLTYAHRAGVVHRDVKPANILIDEDGDAVVTDFGIAKAAERPSQTQSGALVGTPAYMSPEQCRGGEVSWASDQYALGAVAYEMITGSPPFEGSTFTVMQAQVERAPRPPAELREECDPDLEAAILRMLAKERSARFGKMADAMTALEAAPLADGDPLRDELSRLVAPGDSDDPPTAPPMSAPGLSRSSGRWSMSGRSVGGISILPAPAGLEAGDSFMLVAVIRGQQGTRLPPRAVEWTSDNPEVLRIDAGGTTATAMAPGSATLSASSKGVSARHRVEISPPRADEIDIAPADEPLRVGDEIRLDATARDKRGWPVQRSIAWRSDNPSVAEVTPHGSIAGHAPGTVRLTCFLDDAEASIVLPVLPPKVAVVVLGEAPGTVAVGGTFLLTATALDRRNQPLVRRGISWTSSDGAIAVVTAEGWVAAVRPGTVVITAGCEGASASVHLTVTERSAVAPPAPAPPPRSEPVLRRRSRRSRRRRIAAVLGAFAIGAGVWTWLHRSPALPPETATVASGPAVSAQPESESTSVGLPAPDASSPPAENVDRTSSGAATPPPPSGPVAAAISIAIPPALRVGDSLTLRALALGASGDTLAGMPIRWWSDDGAVVAVNPRSGVARALAPGTVTVRARAGRRSAATELTVLPAAVATLQILGARPMAVGEMLSLHIRAVDSWGMEVDGRLVTWASADSSVVAVDAASGVVTARAPGLTHVTAAVEGVTARVPLTVVARPVPLASRGDRADAVVAAALRKGVEECYGALRGRDFDRIEQLYRPLTKSDQETLKRLTRQLRTGGGTSIGQRTELAPEIHTDKAAAEFLVELSWVDGSGTRRRAQPLFRAEFERQDAAWPLTACRIVGPSGL